MTKDMTQGSPLKLILAFAVPLMLGSLFQQFYNLADTIIVGRFVGVEALAAVGSVGGLNYLVLGFVNGIACGFSIPISWTFGAHEPPHDDGIGQIVELLKQAAQHQRDRKGEDQLERAALCHIFCHVSALLWGSSKATKPIFCRQKRPAGKGAGRCGFHECDYIRLR